MTGGGGDIIMVGGVGGGEIIVAGGLAVFVGNSRRQVGLS